MFHPVRTGDIGRVGTLRPVTFRFAERMEVHCLAKRPEVGDLVTHGREIWVVGSVDDGGAGTIVACERREAGDRSRQDGVSFPPVTPMTSPTTNRDSSEARNT